MTVEEFNVLAERAYYIRGMVINESIYIEKALEYYIATHYCGDTPMRDKMIENFLTNDVQFKGKVNAFRRIVKTIDQAWLEKNNEILENLNRIIKDRNILAHEVLDTSAYGKQQYEMHKQINFTKFDRVERSVFSEEYVKEIKEILRNTSHKIALLLPGFSIQPF